MHTDENVNKTNSSILDEQGIQGHFHDTESDEDSDEELEITVLDSEDEEIQLLVDHRDVDYSFLASLCILWLSRCWHCCQLKKFNLLDV